MYLLRLKNIKSESKSDSKKIKSKISKLIKVINNESLDFTQKERVLIETFQNKNHNEINKKAKKLLFTYQEKIQEV